MATADKPRLFLWAGAEKSDDGFVPTITHCTGGVILEIERGEISYGVRAAAEGCAEGCALSARERVAKFHGDKYAVQVVTDIVGAMVQ